MLNDLALKIIAGVCAVLMVVVLIQDRNRWKAKATSLQTTLNEISTRKNVQRKVSGKNVVKVVKGDPVVTERIRIIEAAPVPPNCQTKPEIMNEPGL